MVFDEFSDRRWQAGLWTLALLYLGVVLKDAWLCDDAYISFRTVDNFIHGYGLRWNVSERVQGYTHPLWLFLISGVYWISGEIFYTSIVLSVAVSVAAVAVFVLKIARTPMAAAVGLGLMVCSKAYVDYSTSGLENPLTHLLLSLFLAVYLRDGIRDGRNVFWMGLIAGLALVNRMDSGLIFLPALLLVVRGRLRVVAVGMLPFLLWEIFSLFYYGFPFPNTAYAKLNTGIDRLDLLAQGIYYWIDAFQIDPLIPVTILAGGVLAILRRQHIRLVVGIGLYCFYVVWVGGDFMTGRFLTAPFFCSVCLIAHLFCLPIHRGKYVLIVIFLVGLLMPRSPLRGGMDYGSPGSHRNLNWGIADERAYHCAYTGLWKANLEQHSQVVEGRKLEGQSRSVVFHANMGYFGFYAGPNLHLIDAYGLNEPLFARLYPDARFEIVQVRWGMELKAKPWRIGHFIRKPPAGYQKTQEQGENQIVDPNLAMYYDRLTQVVTGDLWDMDRLKTIWLFHLWQYEDLIRGRKAFMVFQRKAIGFTRRGQWEEAIDVLEQARALYPDHFENLFWMACLYQRVGDAEQAMEMLDRVLGKDPGFSPAVFNRILLLVQADQKEEALNYYKDVIWKRPDTLAVLRHLIFKLMELKQDDLADKFYLEGLRINPELKLN